MATKTGINEIIDEKTISGKSVFAFESHHCALIPWARLSAAAQRPLRLLTLDFHTDTHFAFLHYAHHEVGGHQPNPEAMAKVRQTQVDLIKIEDPKTVETAVTRLRFDEHIDAGIRARRRGDTRKGTGRRLCDFERPKWLSLE